MARLQPDGHRLLHIGHDAHCTARRRRAHTEIERGRRAAALEAHVELAAHCVGGDCGEVFEVGGEGAVDAESARLRSEPAGQDVSQHVCEPVGESVGESVSRILVGYYGARQE